jgi:hypothetical protein
MKRQTEFLVRLTALTLVGLGCADLTDADPCYRFARLVCEKAGADDAGCRDPRRSACYADIDEQDNAAVYTSCADHLNDLGDCLSAEQLKTACPEVPPGLISLSCGEADDSSVGGSGGSSKGGSGGTGGSKGGSGGTGGSKGGSGGTGGSKGGSGGTGGSKGGSGGTGGSTGGSSASGGTGGTAGKGGSGGTGMTAGSGGTAGAPSGACASLAQDFSEDGSNPDGAWSYGYTMVLGSPFTLLPTFCTTQDDVLSGAPSVVRWTDTCGTANTLPVIGLNPSSTAVHSGVSSSYPAGTNTVPPGATLLHPGPGMQFAVARWTAPTTAAYTVEVTFSGESGYSGSPVTTTDVHVLVGTSSLFSTVLNSGVTGNSVSTSFVRDVPAGTYVDFVVGSNGSPSFDSTGVDAVICASAK